MNNKYLFPIVVVISILLGLFLGVVVVNRSAKISHVGRSFLQGQSKLEQLINYVSEGYVDALNVDSITEDMIIDILAKLDPHSSYIPAKDLEMVNSELEGSFSGIGVQFNIQNDTINIVSVLSGGPSEGMGVLAGDKIITVDDSLFVGKGINNEKVMNTLRGTKGTTVKLGILRIGTPETLYYTITRGDIPIHSVDAAYMITGDIGMIRIGKFGQTTYAEFLDALAKLRNNGAKKYIVDLRENTGGFMDQAINMANEFLDAGQLIVYAEGNAYPRFEAHANGKGNFKQAPLVVLIDEFSASASEIFAGAMQDHDRALIVGRRSFGKGLVQQQIPFTDGSAMRLTVARYYTPSGRSIQKPYEMGNSDDYELDIYKRFEHGEFYNRDSIQLADSTVYLTTKGRTVYGGGGIMPDLFVARDTIGYTAYYNQVVNRAYTYLFAYSYTNAHREQLNQYKTWQALEEHLNKQNLLPQLVKFVQEKGVEPNRAQIEISKHHLMRFIKAYIVRNILNDEGFYPIFMRDDVVVKEAVKQADMLQGSSVVE